MDCKLQIKASFAKCGSLNKYAKRFLVNKFSASGVPTTPAWKMHNHSHSILFSWKSHCCNQTMFMVSVMLTIHGHFYPHIFSLDKRHIRRMLWGEFLSLCDKVLISSGWAQKISHVRSGPTSTWKDLLHSKLACVLFCCAQLGRVKNDTKHVVPET